MAKTSAELPPSTERRAPKLGKKVACVEPRESFAPAVPINSSAAEQAAEEPTLPRKRRKTAASNLRIAPGTNQTAAVTETTATLAPQAPGLRETAGTAAGVNALPAAAAVAKEQGDERTAVGAKTQDAAAKPAAGTKAAPVLPWMRVPVSIEAGGGVALDDVRGLADILKQGLQKGMQHCCPRLWVDSAQACCITCGRPHKTTSILPLPDDLTLHC